MAWQYFSLAFLAGAVLPIQVGLNTTLSNITNNPIWAAMASFVLGIMVLYFIFYINKYPFPNVTTIKSVPWWAWFGGILGAIYVASSIIVAPQIGAANLVTFVVAGQMFVALVCDHYGFAGFEVHAISLTRVIGASLLVSGVVLIRYF